MNATDFYSLVDRDRLWRAARNIRRPTYLYFREIMERQYRRAMAALPAGARVHYAVKANPYGPVLRFLRDLGAGADVASLGELRLVLEAGFRPADIEFSGPGKTVKELRAAIQIGIGSLNVESVAEMVHVLEVCRSERTRARIGLRINPESGAVGASLKMSGDAQFGIAERDLPEAFQLLRSAPDLVEVTGIHCHLGSQILQAEAIVSNFATILATVRRAEELGNLQTQRINFGGGWGIAYFQGQRSLDLEALREGLLQFSQKGENRGLLARTRMVVELGRFLVAESGVYLTRVLYVKRGLSKMVAIVDGGMHHNYIAAGGMGQVVRRNFELQVITPGEPGGSTLPISVAGCLCTPNDFLGAEVDLPANIQQGDIVAIFNSGAYGFSASPLRFLSHPLPREKLI